MSAGSRLDIGVHYARASHFSNFDWASNFNNYRTRNVAVAATQNHSTGVPDDFLSALALYLIFIPNGAAAGTLTLASEWGQRGQLINQQAGGPTAYNYPAASGSKLIEVDVLTVLGANAGLLAAGDGISLAITNTAGQTCSFVYSELRYVRKQS